jgi:hypothetical protein
MAVNASDFLFCLAPRSVDRFQLLDGKLGLLSNGLRRVRIGVVFARSLAAMGFS